MYQKILVPLDCSEAAEAVLPHIKALAKCGALGEVVLLSVVEGLAQMHTSGVPDAWVAESADIKKFSQTLVTRAKDYLTRVQSELAREGIKAKVEAVEGKAAQTIIDEAKENNCDLIVIASRGSSGLKQIILGSVALRVLHDSPIPVLLVRLESSRG